MNIHDARARYTRQQIRQEFLLLLEEKSINQITVKELCQRCKINRATFYKHYQDVYDLLGQLEKELLDGLSEMRRRERFQDMDGFFVDILSWVKENAGLWLILSSPNGDTDLFSRMFEEQYQSAFSILQGHFSSHSQEEQEMM